MAAPKNPGPSTGNQGGIYQQAGRQGGKKPNDATVPDHKPLPPATKPGDGWMPVKVTPISNRRCGSGSRAAAREAPISNPFFRTFFVP